MRLLRVRPAKSKEIPRSDILRGVACRWAAHTIMGRWPLPSSTARSATRRKATGPFPWGHRPSFRAGNSCMPCCRLYEINYPDPISFCGRPLFSEMRDQISKGCGEIVIISRNKPRTYKERPSHKKLTLTYLLKLYYMRYNRLNHGAIVARRLNGFFCSFGVLDRSYGMSIIRNAVDNSKFNQHAKLPYELRLKDFEMAMQDVYDFFFDVNSHLTRKGLQRLDDMLRPAIMSGVLSDMITASLAKHSRTLAENRYFNGHPDLIVQGIYPDNSVKAGTEGIEIKTTRKPGGAVDTHGARDQWLCVFVYDVDTHSEPASSRKPTTFTEIYLEKVTVSDFRRNPRSELGTRTATLHRDGIRKLRENWIYRL